MQFKILSILLPVLVLMALVVYCCHLMVQLHQTASALEKAQNQNTVLSVQIQTDERNEAENRASTARQLAKEQQLRAKADKQLKQLRATTKGDHCAPAVMPDGVIKLLRQPTTD